MTQVLTKSQANLVKILDAIQVTLSGESWSLAMEARPHVYEGNLEAARNLAVEAITLNVAAMRVKLNEVRDGGDREFYVALRDVMIEARRVTE
jgi:hypothetical protein